MRTWIIGGIVVPVACLVAIALFAHSHKPRAFCSDRGSGATQTAAIEAYVHHCGRRYTLTSGPLDVVKRPASYASYAALTEYRVNVLDNSAGKVAHVLVGKPTASANWRTLGRPSAEP